MSSGMTTSLVINLLRAVMMTLLLYPGITVGQETELTEYDISLELICKSSTLSRSLDEEGTRLTSQKVILREGDTPEQLLERNGIKADGESFGLLYRLNPGFDTKPIKPGSGIILPTIKDRQRLSADFEKGCLVALWLDKEQKLAFLRFVNELESYSKMIPDLKGEQFGTSDIKEKFTRASTSIVDNMRNFLEFLRFRARPIDSDTLRRMLREGEQLEIILMKIVKNNQKVTASDVETIDRIENNMSTRMKALKEQKGNEGAKRTPFKTIEGVSWNAWFEDTSMVDVEDTLVVNKRYKVNLDLSRYEYSKRYAAVPDSRASAKISGEGVRLILQPIIIGGLVQGPGNKPFESKELVLNRSRMVPDATDKEKAKAYEDRKISTRIFAGAVNLGSIVSWDIVAKSPGCATLAFSVWNDAQTEPLDHLLVTFPVVNEGGTPLPECVRGVAQKGMHAGLDTLLVKGPSGVGAEGGLADAALHVFEIFSGDEKRSLAIFVNHAELKEAGKNPSAFHQGVYSWELPAALSEYVSRPDQLPQDIASAQEYARGGDKYPYREIVKDLDVAIFGPITKMRTQAQLARESLNRLKKGAVVLTRLVSAGGGVIYLPLGLLTARTHGSQDAAMDRRFTVLQTLPQQRPIENACIGSLTFAMPKQLGGVTSGNEAEDLKKNSPPADGWLENHEKLVKYLETEDPKLSRGEGLILLAHHGGGFIWYSQSEVPARISAKGISRKFPEGSVAIFAACSTSKSDKENRLLVERLNQKGIDAMILSPFAVVPAFGIRLALSFQKHAVGELQKPSGATFLEIFQRASADAIKAFDQKPGYQDMVLEFQVVGRASLRFCGQEEHRKGK